jgi:hypothetical protein
MIRKIPTPFSAWISATDLFCSLIAGVLMIGLALGAARHEPPAQAADFAPSAPGTAQLEELAGAVAAAKAEQESLRGDMDHVETAVAGRSQLALLKEALQALQATMAEHRRLIAVLERKVTAHDELRAKTRRLNEELAGLLARIRGIQDRIAGPDPAGASADPDLFGSYRGPYVLIECLDEGAVVHPAGKRIAVDPSPSEKEWLGAEMEKQGFVAIVVRPAAFAGSFDKLLPAVRGLIAASKGRGKEVGLSFLPIESDKPLDKYIPRRNKP